MDGGSGSPDSYSCSTMKPPSRSTRAKVPLTEFDPGGSSNPTRKPAVKTSKAKKVQEEPEELEDSEDSDDEDLPEAALPDDAREIPLNGRDRRLPRLFIVKAHMKVKDQSSDQALIILIYCDWRKPAMTRLFQYAANLQPPTGERDAGSKGDSHKDPPFRSLGLIILHCRLLCTGTKQG